MKGLLLVSAIALTVSAQAVDFFNVNFETSQGYTIGELDGQQGWLTDDPTYQVVAGPTGGQSASWTGGSFGWAWQNIPGGYSGSDMLWTTTQVWLDAASANSDRFYGVMLFTDEDAIGLTVNSTGAVSAGVTFGEVEGGNVVGTLSNPLGRWITVGVGYSVGSTSATLYFDGQTATYNGITAATTITDGDLFSDYSVSSASSSTAYWDNYYVGTTSPVPEPATMAVLGLGAAALLRRRKK